MLYFLLWFLLYKETSFIVESPFAATNYIVRRFRNMILELFTGIGCAVFGLIGIATVVGIIIILGFGIRGIYYYFRYGE